MPMDFVVLNKAKVFQFLFKYSASTFTKSEFMRWPLIEYPWSANLSLAVLQSTVIDVKE